MFRFLTFCGLILSSPILHADLLIAPSATPSTVLTTSQSYEGGILDDQVFFAKSLGFSFRFFGTAFSQFSVSVNGNLNDMTTGLDQFITTPLNTNSTMGARIAPLWDDILLINPDLFASNPSIFGTNANPNAIYEQSTVNFYAVTWQNIRLTNDTAVNTEGFTFPNTSLAAQAALFGATTVINGFQFQPNDIAFSYVSSDGNGAFGGSLDAAVGLRLNANTSVPYPVGSTTVIRNPQARDVLPWQGNSFILFREVTDSNGQFVSYDVSVQNLTAVPEPSSIALVLGGLLPLGWRAARKRFRQAAKNA